MIISYTLDENDFLAYQLYSASKSPRVKRQRVLMQFVFAGVYGLLALWDLYRHRFLASAIFFGLGVIWLLLYPVWSRYHYRRHYRNHTREIRKDAIGVPITVEFSDDLIVIKDPGSETKVSVREIEAVNEISTNFFIKLKGGTALIIPKRIGQPDLLRNHLQNLASSLTIPYTWEEMWAWK